MTVFNKGKDRFKSLLDKLRAKGTEDRSDSLTENFRTGSDEHKEQYGNATIGERIRQHKWLFGKSAAAFGLMIAVVWSGHHYVQASMVDYYQVIVSGEEIGIVSDPAKIEQFKQDKRSELSQVTSDVRMVVVEPRIELKHERAFNEQTDDEAVLKRLGGYFSSYPVGVQLMVDGKPMGVLKDESSVQQMLEQMKANAVASLDKKKESGKVGILSASAAQAPVSTELLKADFVQQVEMKEIRIQEEDLMTPDELQKKLETGSIAPTKYTVEEGDCVSCIAKKLDIPKQVIYENNPSVTNDMIKVGQQLDLTVLQPQLSVRTVEKVVENQEIQYDTEYVQDDTMRLGVTETIKAGQNGLKTVTFQLTKVNGKLEEETVLSESIVNEPVKAVIKRGTKVVKGEGTGKFAWPVVSASISSTFGTRWGAFHKGIDITGNKNILAADNGKVIAAGTKSDYGNYVIIDHLNGYTTLYGHMSKILTTKDSIVEKGEKIGIMGSTGDSTGVHLHFEIRSNDSPQNPLKFLNR
ncbi:Murein DD-endopeptidase MepM and murein hydrolase activator NlpD, contain LysM domain [Paenibacillus sp. UNCCL117]|uniref:peptidoglycan DD-metalloendopeptidase family protein n=1 Tax=unclassified Paenibacillus TaxID=185978 RepID=UPI00089185E6|nr:MULTISPECIES: peptidoglycan DD-metalloendopeptidase family protein [unclassified Paenibacillus]SDD85931.1 Murein DD-endopeptidase MepM and murein hydrolase activator NlpD, contain LysM domain [Paenibacillus sp. cl123]SFW54269.1 Murein DD-endopeptidase MepM and murein hydrolase activator NlpD, contain LysM domain [Paenibacillus sp. UNCCL117]